MTYSDGKKVKSNEDEGSNSVVLMTIWEHKSCSLTTKKLLFTFDPQPMQPHISNYIHTVRDPMPALTKMQFLQ